MPEGVACTVSNCKYWAENNLCAAAEILIEIDAHAKQNKQSKYNSEFSADLSEAHQDVASQSAETCCLTFAPKER